MAVDSFLWMTIKLMRLRDLSFALVPILAQTLESSARIEYGGQSKARRPGRAREAVAVAAEVEVGVAAMVAKMLVSVSLSLSLLLSVLVSANVPVTIPAHLNALFETDSLVPHGVTVARENWINDYCSRTHDVGIRSGLFDYGYGHVSMRFDIHSIHTKGHLKQTRWSFFV